MSKKWLWGIIPGHQKVSMNDSIEELRAELERERARSAHYKRLAMTDVLTSLYSRRYGLDELQDLDADRRDAVRESGDRRKHVDGYALLLVDIDHFKRVNDTADHSVGDQVLVQIADTIRKVCRASDIPVRWGGEEFLIICHNTSSEDAHALAQRLRTAVEQACIGPSFGLPWSVTASVGVSQPATVEEGFETVIQRADAALYKAKDSGRNCIIQIFGEAA